MALNKRVDDSGLRGGKPSGPYNNNDESRGGHIGMPVVADEPSGGVVGLYN